MTLPTLTVKLDDGTGTFPFNITSKVLAVDGYEITRGRDDWQGAVTAGELSLTLENSDGRFTPGSTILATPSPIVVDQRIRLQETVNFVNYTRFTGYVKAWPVEWPATVATVARAKISATDAQARAERRILRSMLEEEFLLDGPTAYYTLGEPEGSTTAGDTSGAKEAPLELTGPVSPSPVVFGNGTGPVDGLSAVQFSYDGTHDSQYLSANSVRGGFTTGGSWSLEMFAASGLVPLTNMVVVLTNGTQFYNITYSGPNGSVAFNGPSVSGPVAAPGDNGTHHFVMTFDGSITRGYIDGTGVFTSGAAAGGTNLTSLLVGSGSNGTMSHVAVYDGVALSAARVASHFAAATAAEAGDARITRLASYVPLTVGTLDAGLTTVTAAVTSGASAQQAINDVAAAELGLVYINGSGSLVFHNRNEVATKTAPDLTLTSQWVTPDVKPVLDDQRIVNYFEPTAAGTGATGLVVNTASEDAHGRYPESATYLVQTDAEALDRASWIVSRFAEPTPRYGTLTVNLYGMTAAQASTVLAALDLDCWLRVTSLATQNPGGTVADVVVQGWTETVSADTWTITCNVVAHSLYTVGLLDDTTLGLLDSTMILYV